MATRDEIEARYKADLEVAEAWRDANPERYSEARQQAMERRADSYSSMADESNKAAQAATLAQARVSALSKYPKAAGMSQFLSGGSPDEIEASAKAIHEGVVKAEEEAVKAANVARRPQTRAAWTGSPTGRQPGMPGGELEQPSSQQTEMVGRVYNRTAEIIAEARKPGTLREYSPDASAVLRAQDPEAQALADHELLTPNTGLSRKAFEARSRGEATMSNEPISAEDRKG